MASAAALPRQPAKMLAPGVFPGADTVHLAPPPMFTADELLGLRGEQLDVGDTVYILTTEQDISDSVSEMLSIGKGDPVVSYKPQGHRRGKAARDRHALPSERSRVSLQDDDDFGENWDPETSSTWCRGLAASKSVDYLTFEDWKLEDKVLPTWISGNPYTLRYRDSMCQARATESCCNDRESNSQAVEQVDLALYSRRKSFGDVQSSNAGPGTSRASSKETRSHFSLNASDDPALTLAALCSSVSKSRHQTHRPVEDGSFLGLRLMESNSLSPRTSYEHDERQKMLQSEEEDDAYSALLTPKPSKPLRSILSMKSKFKGNEPEEQTMSRQVKAVRWRDSEGQSLVSVREFETSEASTEVLVEEPPQEEETSCSTCCGWSLLSFFSYEGIEDHDWSWTD